MLRQSSAKANLLVGTAGFLAICAVTPFLAPHRGPPGSVPSPERIAAITAAVAIGVVWCGVFVARGFRRYDEFHQRGEQVSWFWGGLAGLMASVPAFAFIGMGGLTLLWPDAPRGRPLFEAFSWGYMLALAFQAAGALMAAIWWRVSKR